jgi:hypothetical protein
MKKYILLIIATIAFCATSTLAQENKLNYSWGHFNIDDGGKTHWKSADHLFEHDQELLNKYVSFRNAKKTANILGIACLTQAVTGLAILFIPNKRCESLCEHHFIGLALFALTAPATGLIGIVVAGVASARKSKLVYLYDRQDLSSVKGLNDQNNEISLSLKGLGLSLTYSF